MRLYRRPISRRAFLGGAGVALTLPFLPSLFRSNRAFAQDAACSQPIKRFIAYYVPNGIHMQDWTPATTGAGYALPYILTPLAAFQDRLLVLTGLKNEKQEEGPGDHAGGTGSFLTCKTVRKASVSVGVSMDQLIARAVGGCTDLPSLELGTEGGGSTGTCDSGYGCAYQRNISWADASTPMPKVADPGVVFDRLFAGFDPSENLVEVERRRKLRSSVLDYVRADANSLSGRLGTGDRAKMDQYLTGIRELEARIQRAAAAPVCSKPERPGNPSDLTQHIEVMHDLMALSFQCDATRVISFMLGNSGSGRNFSFIGASGGHHDISHHQSNEENFAKLRTIGHWEMERFAHLLGVLAAIPEGEGKTALDNTAVFLSSEISDGDRHNHDNLPVLVAGGLGGVLNTGRHVRYDGNPPLANLYIALMQQFGVQASTFGDRGDGPLGDLVV